MTRLVFALPLLVLAAPVAATPNETVPLAKSIAEMRIPAGATKAAYLKIDVAKDGSVDSCEVVKSSGDVAWDNRMCNIMAFSKTFQPSLNENGRPKRGTRIVPVWQ